MAFRGNRVYVKLRSSASGYFYYTTKNKTITRRLEFKKYDPTVRKHVLFKEEK